eukprot:704317_1
MSSLRGNLLLFGGGSIAIASMIYYFHNRSINTDTNSKDLVFMDYINETPSDVSNRDKYERDHLSMKGTISWNKQTEFSDVKMDAILFKFFEKEMLGEENPVYTRYKIDYYDLWRRNTSEILLIMQTDRDYELLCQYLAQHRYRIAIHNDIVLQITDIRPFKGH